VAEAGRRRRGNTYSAAAAGGETRIRHYARRWEQGRNGTRADADTCRSLTCFPWQSAAKRRWTSWRLLKSGCSRPDEGGYGAGAEADSEAGSGSGRIPPFLVLSVLAWVGLLFDPFICQRG